MARARASARSRSPAWATALASSASIRTWADGGDGAGQGLGVGGQPGRVVPRVCAAAVASWASACAWVSGPVMARRGPRRGPDPPSGGYGGQLAERLVLGAAVGDGAGQGLGMIEASEPCPHDGQVGWDGLVTDGDGVPVDGQLHQSLQIRHLLGRDEALRIPDLGESGVVASGGPQQERVPARVAGERRQPRTVAGRGEQARVAADGVARRGIGPAALGVGADPVVDSFAGSGLVRCRVVPRR